MAESDFVGAMLAAGLSPGDVQHIDMFARRVIALREAGRKGDLARIASDEIRQEKALQAKQQEWATAGYKPSGDDFLGLALGGQAPQPQRQQPASEDIADITDPDVLLGMHFKKGQ